MIRSLYTPAQVLPPKVPTNVSLQNSIVYYTILPFFFLLHTIGFENLDYLVPDWSLFLKISLHIVSDEELMATSLS